MLSYLYPMRTFIIVAGTIERPNPMTADWVTPLSFSPPLAGVAIGKTRYTRKLVEEQKEFVIAVPTVELLKDVWIAGTTSGARENKAEKMSVTFVPSQKVSAPSIKECAANIECKVVKEVETGDHIFFVGEIVNVTYGDAFKNGEPDVENFKFLMHAKSGAYFTYQSGEIIRP
ncbi:flavin reductase domain protein FMN-binding protein [Ferroglobus placidus DSM 10642]|uniref:Flavin reductase domain protein FMN-binding protein n=1 Tax=Ferroglobus placidus (strain DSM 10642 / AEDII12DO) TaxID=589924 RepID=D3RZ34_FERPA|nr:flavin reductase family protein [Ferroglobus placidus]ADC65747.1 flavin reductase domain protein FMN-binding protein [Ferroglobus placidus DSM 10642]